MFRQSLLAVAVGLFAVPAVADSIDGLKPVTHETTKTECSACHMAYQAAFLPASSWSHMMNSLSDHFGEDASLDETTRQDIEAYLVANASRERFKSFPDGTPPQQISSLSWFVEEHSEEASKAELAKAGSYANCTACHKQAEAAYFDDD